MPWQIPRGGWRNAPFPPPPAADIEAAMLSSLARLDPAIARWRRQRLVARLWWGVAGHFHTRAPEWFAAACLFQMGWTLFVPPASFPVSHAWDSMAAMLPEEVWGAIMLMIGGLRLAALTVNGSFRRFRWSPHVRAGTAFLACGVWLQVVLGIWASAPSSTGLGTYRLILVLEFWNMWRAARDTGIVERSNHHGRT